MTTNYNNYREWWQLRGQPFLEDYALGKSSYVVSLAPQRALEFTGVELLQVLNRRLGAEVLQQALDPTTPYPSPVAIESSGDWLKNCHTVGINVRTIGSFWNVLKYALTLPNHIRGIHLLPIWEPGVVGSLYGMASWNLNPEFLDLEAASMFSDLRTVEEQLAVVINLLHAMGKVVGMDVIPHTDRYSEMVLANPSYFEWLVRDDLTITDHRENLHEAAETHILNWLLTVNPLISYTREEFFGKLSEAERLVLLFGQQKDYDRRRERRVSLVDYLYRRGFEPVPATMAPPYRGLEVDANYSALTIDDAGRSWRDFRITEPTEMSRVFGPLTRFKFYGRQDDNRDWAIDFSSPRKKVWDYFVSKYAEVQAKYNFDFMRGDMSHVQMRPAGVPPEPDGYYDPLRAVKSGVAATQPSFAYFAETFLAEPDVMAYGDEVDHLEASHAEVTLGNLQSMVPGSDEFRSELLRYLDIANQRDVVPAFTVITGDKDDPRFDLFHHHGEIARLFTGLFLGTLPLYYSLGFEQRDRHFEAAPNEYYTKLYVFQEREGPKSVSGNWRWGDNMDLFGKLQEVHRFAEGTLPHLGAHAGALHFRENGCAYWLRQDSYGDSEYLFVVNFSPREITAVSLSITTKFGQADLLFALPTAAHHSIKVDAGGVNIGSLGGGAVRCYQLR